MGDSKTHPHIDLPTEDELKGLVEGKPPTVRQLYHDTHRLVLETVPDLAYSVDSKDGGIGYGVRQHGYDGWAMAALAPYTKCVSLAFLRGIALDDPEGLLEGSGAAVRHLKLRSSEELSKRRNAIQGLRRAAVGLNST